MIKQKLKPCKRCGDPCYLFSGGMCRNCWGMSKVQEQREQPTLSQTDDKPAKPFRVIKPVSDKQASRLKLYRIARDEYFKEKPVCEYPGCTSTKITLHHGAGRIGDLLFDKRYFKSLCMHHHEWAESHPEEAKELKLSFDRLDK